MQGLGLEYARQLAQAGCGHLLLTGRMPIVSRAVLVWFAAHDVTMWTARVDAGQSLTSESVLRWLHERLPPLGQYVHAAGISRADALPVINSTTMWHVMAPKVCHLTHCYFSESSDSLCSSIGQIIVGKMFSHHIAFILVCPHPFVFWQLQGRDLKW